jgi:hypothetical protein
MPSSFALASLDEFLRLVVQLESRGIERRATWTLRWSVAGPRLVILRETGHTQFSYGAPTITMPAALSAAVAALWRKNEYGEFVGALTLLGLCRKLGYDVTQLNRKIREARSIAANELAAAERAGWQAALAAQLTATLEVLAGRHGGADPVTVAALAPVLQEQLDALTRANPRLAQDAAERVARMPL